VASGAINYFIEVEHVGHGFRKFVHYRPRLLHCGVALHTRQTARLRGRSPRSVA
jgi:hypothetical protein